MYYPQQMNQYCGGQYLPSQTGLKGRPVTSIEEARAANIDFDGSLFIFPDIINKKIYTKQINLDGTAVMKVYSQVEDAPSAPSYVTKEEFDSKMQTLESLLEKERKNESSSTKQSISKSITF